MKRIEDQIQRSKASEPYDRWGVDFPFPSEGALVPIPDDREEARKIFFRVKQVLRVTTEEFAVYLGVKWKTVQKWEQGEHGIDPSTWTLLQLALRLPEVRFLIGARPANHVYRTRIG